MNLNIILIFSVFIITIIYLMLSLYKIYNINKKFHIENEKWAKNADNLITLNKTYEKEIFKYYSVIVTYNNILEQNGLKHITDSVMSKYNVKVQELNVEDILIEITEKGINNISIEKMEFLKNQKKQK